MENLQEMKKIIKAFKRFLVDEAHYREWRKIVIHHSLTKDRAEIPDWDAIRRYHTSYVVDGKIVTEEEYNNFKINEPRKHWFKKPWRDIGYHFGIELVQGQYVIQPGRSLAETGAHARAQGKPNIFNEEGIGICVVGNYDISEPPEGAVSQLVYLCRMLMGVFDIPKSQIIGHRDIYPYFGLPQYKSCPGKMFDVDKVRSMI